MTKTVLLLLILLQLQWGRCFNSQSRFEFAANFFNTTTTFQPYENVIVSPVAVQACLAMTYLGAGGQTAAEMGKVLALENFPTKEHVAYDFWEFLQEAIKSPQSKLEMANRVYVDNRLQLKPAYNELINVYFQTTVAPVKFTNRLKTARDINEWFKRETHGKIQNVISAAELTSDTRMVLTSAIYFKAEWLYPFDPTITIPRDFYLNLLEKIKVPMMYRTDVNMRYGEITELDLVAAELPFKDTELRMLILLPNQLDGGVARLEQVLSANTFLYIQRSLRQAKLDIVMPKFRIESDLSLIEPLKSMGLNSIFNDAELTDMITEEAARPLYVSEIKHKAYISVDERGSEASGATYSQLLEKSGRFFAPNLNIDRPFVFAIMDDKAIYFVGHLLKF